MASFFEQFVDIFGSSSDDEEFLGFTNAELGLESDIEVNNLSDSELSCSSDAESEVESTFTRNLTHIEIEEFNGPEPGQKFPLSADKNEMDFLDLFFPEQIYHLVAEQTNLYAGQKIQSKPDPLWKETTSEEVKAYIGIRLFMAIKKLPETKMYWSDDDVFGGEKVKQIMPRNRFDKLSQYLHVNDRSKMPNKDHADFDKLFLVRPVLDIVRTRCLENYNPHKECAVDEAMVSFRGRLDFRQYLPAKPTKYGIKVWMRADSHNGYCNDFEVYLGKPKDGQRQVGLGKQVVERMTATLRGTNSHIYCDNYFSSPDLCHSLRENGLYCCGTVKTNSKRLPDEVRSKKKLNALVKDAGDFEQFQKDGLLVSAWREKKGRKPVLVVSTNSDPAAGPSTIQRKQKNGDIVDVPCVEPVINYNSWMNAVDHSDQIRTTYSIARSSKRWWLYLFWFLFDLALANAFICFKESTNHVRLTKENTEKTATILAFKKAIVKHLLHGKNFYKRKQNSTGAQANDEGHGPKKSTSARRCKNCAANKKRAESRVICQGCSSKDNLVHLCIDCFQEYHERR